MTEEERTDIIGLGRGRGRGETIVQRGINDEGCLRGRGERW